MKKVISITLALIMALSLSVTAFAATITPVEPSKDSNGVYQIGTAAELYGFAQLVNNGQTSIKAVLTADIVVNENVLNESGELNSENIDNFVSWTPIGNSSKNYKGTFDGQGHTISGLYFNDSNTDYVGLFGRIGSGGKVSNVGVINSYIYGKEYIGGVCGYDYGTITGCYNKGKVSGTGNCIGGVCGENNSGVAITNCYNTGTVSGANYVGGVCGNNYGGTITNCYNKGVVNGTGVNIGGVCGSNGSSAAMTDCYNTGTVNGTYQVGGVCGTSGKSATITACYNISTVSGESYVGGVCGCNYNKVSACYSTGTVSGTSNIGSVCGYISSKGIIKYCYTNNGEVYGTNNGTVTNCAICSDDEFADGTVIGLLNAALGTVVFYQVADIDPYPVLTDNSKRSVEVEYSVAPTYTVTIPETVKLGETATVRADNVVLEKGKYVKVSLTGTSGESNAFTVTSGEGAVLEYTVNDGTNNVSVGSTVLTVNPTNGKSGSATLRFSEPTEKKFSGSYTGTLTFTVSVG